MECAAERDITLGTQSQKGISQGKTTAVGIVCAVSHLSCKAYSAARRSELLEVELTTVELGTNLYRMLSVNNAYRITVLNFLRCAYRRGEAGVAQPAKAGNLEQSEAIECRIVGNARNCQIWRRRIKTIGRNAICVVLPIKPPTQVIHDSGRNGPGMPKGESTAGVVGDSLRSVAAVSESR